MEVLPQYADAVVDCKDGEDVIPCSLFVLARESAVLREVVDSTAPVIDSVGRRVICVPNVERSIVAGVLEAMHTGYGCEASLDKILPQAIHGAALLGADPLKAFLLERLCTIGDWAEVNEFLGELIEMEATRVKVLKKLMRTKPLWRDTSWALLGCHIPPHLIPQISVILTTIYPCSVVSQWALLNLPSKACAAEIMRVFSADLVCTAHPAEVSGICTATAAALDQADAKDMALFLKNMSLPFNSFKVHGSDMYSTTIIFNDDPSVNVHITTSNGELPSRFTHRLVPWMFIDNDMRTGFIHFELQLLKLDKTLEYVKFVEVRIMLLNGCAVVHESWHGFNDVDTDLAIVSTQADWVHNVLTPIDPALIVTAQRIDVFYSNSKPKFRSALSGY